MALFTIQIIICLEIPWWGGGVTFGRFSSYWGKDFSWNDTLGNFVANNIINTFLSLGWHHIVLSEGFWVNGYDS